MPVATTRTPRRSPGTAQLNAGHNGKLDRSAIVKDINEWMRLNCPGDGVDRLATRPIDFALMALAVKWLHTDQPRQQIERTRCLLQELRETCIVAIADIDGICRIAMNARKQGKLHPHEPSPGTKAAQTRRDRNPKGRP